MKTVSVNYKLFGTVSVSVPDDEQDILRYIQEKLHSYKISDRSLIEGLERDDAGELAADSIEFTDIMTEDGEIIFSTTEDSLDYLPNSMTLDEIVQTVDENSYLTGVVLVEMNEMIGLSAEEFQALLVERFVGECGLRDVSYRFVRVFDDKNVLIEVTGQVIGLAV